MFYKLLKFVILSRFSKQLLALMVVLLAWALFISFETGSTSSASIYHYYGPAFLTFFLVLPVMSGGIAVLKSDRDFLFTLPVKRSELALSLFVVQLLSFGLIVLYVVAYSFSSLRSVFDYALVDFLALILTVTALGPITYSLRLGWRVLLALMLVVWGLSSLLGFPYSPASIYSGHPLYAAITSVILAVITVPLAFRSLSRVDLDLMKTFTRYTSSEVKHVRRFSGMSPTKAMLAENFFIVEISGRMNSMGGGGSYRSGRFKLWKGMLVTAVIAGAYYYMLSYRLSIPVHSQELVVFILSIYSVVLVMFLTMGVLGNERLWLGFMTRNPERYLRDLLALKSLSISALLSPLAVANLLLGIGGNEQAINFGLFLLVVIPSLLVVAVIMSAFLYPFQIKEDISMPGQFNLRQMGTILPILPAWFLVALSFGLLEDGLPSIAMIVTILTSLVMAGISISLLLSKSVGRRVIDRLVTAGFV